MSDNLAAIKPEPAKPQAEKPESPRPETAKTDRRILRTRDTLGDALVELMHEKPFEEITVQEILDRAGVGRSTFYTHYPDKRTRSRILRALHRSASSSRRR